MPRRLATSPRLRAIVFTKIRADWSPQQISAWLKATYPTDLSMQLSHEAIYQTLYVQARGALKRELVSHLRRHRGLRRSGGKRTATTGQIVGAVSIAERPPQVEDRAVPFREDQPVRRRAQDEDPLLPLVEPDRCRLGLGLRFRGGALRHDHRRDRERAEEDDRPGERPQVRAPSHRRRRVQSYARTWRAWRCTTILRFTRWRALSIVFVSQPSSSAMSS